MFITRKEEKASGSEITTTGENRSVAGTTRNVTPVPARLRGGISGVYVTGKSKPQLTTEDSTWGWATRIHFDPDKGFVID